MSGKLHAPAVLPPPPGGERAPRTPWIGGWVSPRASLDDMKWKFLPHRDSNSDRWVVQPVASRYTDWAIPAPIVPAEQVGE
jgi:hypothetical protein